ncbi:MAG: MBL fold metallo-hydrolase [Pyrinomonadaceae bacterium]
MQTSQPGTTSAAFSEYIFEPHHHGGGLPQVVAHTVASGAPFCFAPDFVITPIEVIHGQLPVMAYRFNDFAYATDVSQIPPPSMNYLRGLDVLVLDCLRFKEHPTHLNLDRALEYIAELRPRRTLPDPSCARLQTRTRFSAPTRRRPLRLRWTGD